MGQMLCKLGKQTGRGWRSGQVTKTASQGEKVSRLPGVTLTEGEAGVRVGWEGPRVLSSACVATSTHCIPTRCRRQPCFQHFTEGRQARRLRTTLMPHHR